jgi:hypothetical protein
MPGERCSACGYDLAGNTGGKCPECGLAGTSRVQRRPAAWDRGIWVAAWLALAGFHVLWGFASFEPGSGWGAIGMVVYAVPIAGIAAGVILLAALAAVGVRALCVEAPARASGRWVLSQVLMFFLVGGVLGAGVAAVVAFAGMNAVPRSGC